MGKDWLVTRQVRRYARIIARPMIVSDADLRRYVALVAIFAITVAVAIDVVNQLTFFVSWPAAVRSWAISALVAGGIAIPVSLLIARSQRELYRAKQAFEELSRTDPLTGLLNRRALMDLAEQAAACTMVLVIVDVDRFKTVNDTYGHRAGDAVLRGIAGVMAAAVGHLGPVGRLGGEEFALLSTNRSDEVLAAVLDLRARLAAAPMLIDGTAIRVTVSAGVAIRLPTEPFEQLYAEADQALYAAKAHGRNRIELSPRLAAVCGALDAA